ncbi:AraC family transcriptional regulator [Amycolatopsis cihanbeyliensis]|uniref:AraC-like DNA-binding protein n=1 Tax=Amycolatopsis cihanbeyliensis TaxID=1128664 RepID=A0A542DDB5_AMYCI|nr:AraC family transcriptional regulator [Amycolatopsis cihanbeyliensis]TQJ01055.1 AraC-like DNA-binding protein [Amycolatopsis cihanbeyliensis]
MDVFTDLVRGFRADGAMFGQSILTAPWSHRFAHDAALTVCTLLEGAGWLLPTAGEPIRLGCGDVAIVRGPDPFVVADEPGTEPQIVIHGSELCLSTADGTNLAETTRLGPRTWGAARTGTAALLIGAYQARGEPCDRLLRALPPVAVVRAGGQPCPEFELIKVELERERPGQHLVLDRLLDLLLVCTLRDWFDRPEAEPPAWYRALADPVAGPALRAMHDNPAHGWTVAGLARAAGVSRAALARRFTELVGQPPLTYLTSWRMALAADLLREPGSTVRSVATEVGYADGFAFSAAFRRVRGIRPSAHATASGR